MNHDDTLQCPECDAQFEKGDAAWTVCLTCGVISPPGGGGLAGHGPGPGGFDRGDAAFWGECCMSYHVYSEADALEKQDRVRTDKREKYVNAGVTPPWERDGFTEPWAPESGSGGEDE